MSTAHAPVALHLGALHPHEQLITLALAFGPFALLAVVIAVRRRQDAALDEAERASTRGRVPPAGTRTRPESGQRER